MGKAACILAGQGAVLHEGLSVAASGGIGRRWLVGSHLVGTVALAAGGLELGNLALGFL